MSRDRPGGETPARRIARVGIGATAGLVAGTALQAGTGWDLAPAAGAAAGAVVAVLVNRFPRGGGRR